MPIEIANRSPGIRPDPGALRRLVGGVLRAHGQPGRDLTLVLADDALLRHLNARFRGVDRATDVLSFEPAPGPGEPAPGEIYVSMQRVAAQARRYRVSPQRELARLLVHGALHLLGYDHLRPADRARMRARERELLAALGPAAAALFTARDR
ncbi:MAG TPA: rRNA maturation RNase YbeY [Candidatus Saccharimonadales bacterium]|nr:rRNA maturation RNase YbeY [Candidatus Saccharimonadales bacterium]